VTSNAKLTAAYRRRDRDACRLAVVVAPAMRQHLVRRARLDRNRIADASDQSIVGDGSAT
jgi:hypothetical protein